MKYAKGSILLLASTVLVAGCSDIYEPTPKVTQVDSGWVISNTASLANTVVTHDKSDIYTCQQTAPDATFDQGEAADTSFSLVSIGTGGDSGGGGESESSEGVEMAGRTPAVLIAREMFYRTCEFSQNYKLPVDQALKLYQKTMDTVAKAWLVEAGQTTVTIGDTVATTQGTTVSTTGTTALSDTSTQSNTTSQSESDTSSESTSESSSN